MKSIDLLPDKLSSSISMILSTILLVVSTLRVTGQTEEIEDAYLFELANTGQITNVMFSNYAKQWKDLLIEMGGYPKLPYNEDTKTISFDRVIEYPILDKSTIYKRILEWGAICFGSLSEVLHYDDFESGKLIIKGTFELDYEVDYKNIWGFEREKIRSINCDETIIFTVKDNKIKVELTNLDYWTVVGGIELPGSYIPESIVHFSIRDFYPVTKGEPISWKGKINLLIATKENINLLIASLDSYIRNAILDYNF